MSGSGTGKRVVHTHTNPFHEELAVPGEPPLHRVPEPWRVLRTEPSGGQRRPPRSSADTRPSNKNGRVLLRTTFYFGSKLSDFFVRALSD